MHKACFRPNMSASESNAMTSCFTHVQSRQCAQHQSQVLHGLGASAGTMPSSTIASGMGLDIKPDWKAAGFHKVVISGRA